MNYSKTIHCYCLLAFNTALTRKIHLETRKLNYKLKLRNKTELVFTESIVVSKQMN